MPQNYHVSLQIAIKYIFVKISIHYDDFSLANRIGICTIVHYTISPLTSQLFWAFRRSFSGKRATARRGRIVAPGPGGAARSMTRHEGIGPHRRRVSLADKAERARHRRDSVYGRVLSRRSGARTVPGAVKMGLYGYLSAARPENAFDKQRRGMLSITTPADDAASVCSPALPVTPEGA